MALIQFEENSKKIIQLCSSDSVDEKSEGVNILTESLGSTFSLEEQFDVI
jgi:hypothetical protein